MPLAESRYNGQSAYPALADRFSHEQEYSIPGYYRVKLLDENILCELTATKRCGVHRYTYPGGKQYFAVDMKKGNNSRATTLPECFYDSVLVSELEVLDNRTVRGYRVTEGWAREQHVYFYARFSKPFSNYRMFHNLKLVDSASVKGLDERVILCFEDDGLPLEVYVGISPVSMEGAQKNLAAEVEGKNFDQVKAEAHDIWNRELGVFLISDADSESKDLFYTSLYFALLYPQLYSDVDGAYRSSDAKVYKGDFNYYAGVLGFWDTYRNQDPLISVLHPEVMSDLMKTMQQHFNHWGELPIWTIGGQENMCMTGYHAMPVIADAYSKGIRGFDADSLLDAMVVSACRDTFGFFDHDYRGALLYTKYHYAPADLEWHAASKTLEYAYDDWCVAQMARMVGRKDVYKTFMDRAQWYHNVYDPEVGYMNGRGSDNKFRRPFNRFSPSPCYFCSDFCEGNSYQYTFFAPQDPYGLIEMLGGRERFINRLDSLFVTTQEGEKLVDLGRIGQYAHGNEPVHHVIYLYNFVGEPWKCQKWANEVMSTQYNTSPTGMCGNDDTGQMSAWYIQSAMGFFTFNHGQDYYVIGTPRFQHMTFRHSKGTLTIDAHGASRQNCYVQSVRVNGKKWKKSWIRGKDLLGKDVHVTFEMGSEPNKEWASSIKDCPPGCDGRVPKGWK